MPIASGFFGKLQSVDTLYDVLQITGRYFLKRGVVMVSYHHYPPVGAQDYERPITVDAYGFPEEWLEEYERLDYVKIDPIIRRALQHGQPFWWSEVFGLEALRPEERAFMKALQRARLGDGLAVPVFGPRGRNGYAGLGFGLKARALPDHRVATFQMAAQIAHQRYCELLIEGFDHVRLSPREKEVLTWAARGKSNSVIADILELSPNTVDTHFRRTFAKLGVNDRVTAVLRGMALGLLV